MEKITMTTNFVLIILSLVGLLLGWFWYWTCDTDKENRETGVGNVDYIKLSLMVSTSEFLVICQKVSQSSRHSATLLATCPRFSDRLKRKIAQFCEDTLGQHETIFTQQKYYTERRTDAIPFHTNTAASVHFKNISICQNNIYRSKPLKFNAFRVIDKHL